MWNCHHPNHCAHRRHHHNNSGHHHNHGWYENTWSLELAITAWTSAPVHFLPSTKSSSSSYTLYDIYCIMYIIHCMIYSTKSSSSSYTLYDIYCTLYTVWYTLYNVYYTVYDIHCMSTWVWYLKELKAHDILIFEKWNLVFSSMRLALTMVDLKGDRDIRSRGRENN